MNAPGSPTHARRIVREIVVTYTIEGDPDQKEHRLTLSRQEGGDFVDGVIWSRSLMDKLAYVNGTHGKPERPKRRPARPEDGWTRRGPIPANTEELGLLEASVTADGGSETITVDMSTMSATMDTAADTPVENPDCIWLHRESCSWMSFCDPV